MIPLKFVKHAAEIYFDEKEKVWQKSRSCWNFIFIAFCCIYLLQIYGAFINYQTAMVSRLMDPEEFWRMQLTAMRIQGVMLFGIFIRFFAGHFRGKWAVRFGELGEFVAFATLLHHFNWIWEKFHAFHSGEGGAPSVLIGVPGIFGTLVIMFFYGWVFYKLAWMIDALWKTFRK
jgi:hypothetical protein